MPSVPCSPLPILKKDSVPQTGKKNNWLGLCASVRLETRHLTGVLIPIDFKAKKLMSFIWSLLSGNLVGIYFLYFLCEGGDKERCVWKNSAPEIDKMEFIYNGIAYNLGSRK